MIKYKLTTQNNTTYYDKCKWEINVPKETDGKLSYLSSNSWLHFYHTPELAILLNPIHANIENPKLWECEVEGEILDNDYGLKAGCTKMTLLKEITKPEFTNKDYINFAFLCVKEVIKYTSNIDVLNKFIDSCLSVIDDWYKSVFCSRLKFKELKNDFCSLNKDYSGINYCIISACYNLFCSVREIFNDQKVLALIAVEHTLQALDYKYNQNFDFVNNFLQPKALSCKNNI